MITLEQLENASDTELAQWATRNQLEGSAIEAEQRKRRELRRQEEAFYWRQKQIDASFDDNQRDYDSFIEENSLGGKTYRE